MEAQNILVGYSGYPAEARQTSLTDLTADERTRTRGYEAGLVMAAASVCMWQRRHCAESRSWGYVEMRREGIGGQEDKPEVKVEE